MSENGIKLLAVCGKGGTGKTASTAMMARALYESKNAGRLLLIDADPAMVLFHDSPDITEAQAKSSHFVNIPGRDPV